MSVSLADVEAALRARGLAPRGAFHPVEGDGVSALPGGRAAGTLVLAGSVGMSLWARFVRERRDEADPLDRWSARVLGEIAARFDAAVVLPGDGPPHPPFLRWAQRAEPVHPSPLGLLIHPDHGLWHAYRGALAFAERLALPVRDTRESPCTSCRERPCLGACPPAPSRAPATPSTSARPISKRAPAAPVSSPPASLAPRVRWLASSAIRPNRRTST